MSLLERYHQRLQAEGFSPDPDQEAVVRALQRVADQLGRRTTASGWRAWFGGNKPEAVPGLYVWGGVGRGKTWLMDMFFDQVAEPRKQRLHFHRFMQQVHAELAQIRQQRNPLELVARHMAREWRLLCLDEFHVVDIGDAVIFAGLLKALFAQGIVLVTTSNVPPDELYKDGIQRASFLPAIALLQEHLEVRPMGGERDFRVEILTQARVYHWPHSAQLDAALFEEFRHLAPTGLQQDGELLINGRSMPYRYLADNMVWFDFEALCGPPRSQHDYIELARCQHTVFLTQVPQMGASRDDRTRRFIFLIDEFYDRKVKLVISAETPVNRLYQGERLAFEFQRTVSRLTEMQTQAYLGSAHRG
jgi:cell division protein ZapE